MLSLLFCTLPLFDAELRFTALQKPQDSNTFRDARICGTLLHMALAALGFSCAGVYETYGGIMVVNGIGGQHTT